MKCPKCGKELHKGMFKLKNPWLNLESGLGEQSLYFYPDEKFEAYDRYQVLEPFGEAPGLFCPDCEILVVDSA